MNQFFRIAAFFPVLLALCSLQAQAQNLEGKWTAKNCFEINTANLSKTKPVKKLYPNLVIKKSEDGFAGFHTHNNNTVEVKSFTTKNETFEATLADEAKTVVKITNSASMQPNGLEVGIITDYKGTISTELLKATLTDNETMDYRRYGVGATPTKDKKVEVSAFNWGCIYKRPAK